jgi:hypothetical protein
MIMLCLAVCCPVLAYHLSLFLLYEFGFLTARHSVPLKYLMDHETMRTCSLSPAIYVLTTRLHPSFHIL